MAILKMVPEHLDRSSALREDLVRLGRVAAGPGYSADRCVS